jgi:hypothetical protein
LGCHGIVGVGQQIVCNVQSRTNAHGCRSTDGDLWTEEPWVEVTSEGTEQNPLREVASTTLAKPCYPCLTNACKEVHSDKLVGILLLRPCTFPHTHCLHLFHDNLILLMSCMDLGTERRSSNSSACNLSREMFISGPQKEMSWNAQPESIP